MGVMARFFVSDLRTVMIALIVVKASVSAKKIQLEELVFEIGLIAVFFGSKKTEMDKKFCWIHCF